MEALGMVETKGLVGAIEAAETEEFAPLATQLAVPVIARR